MSCLTLSVTPKNTPLSLRAECKNASVSIGAENKNSKMSITATLVCDAWLSDYEVFYVQEGAFRVQDGYFMVKKKE